MSKGLEEINSVLAVMVWNEDILLSSFTVDSFISGLVEVLYFGGLKKQEQIYPNKFFPKRYSQNLVVDITDK